jgi:hypothetical protein
VEAFWHTAAAAEAGIAWERILFQWSQLQPNGPDDWNTLHVPDEWLQWALVQGREVVGLLKNTPYWASVTDPPNEASPPRGLDLPVDDPANLWAAFVRRAVTFFGARGVHRWIIWNEPDILPGVYGHEWSGSIEEYYRLLKVAYLVIKEADPEAYVHLAGTTFWHDRHWLRDFLAVATDDPEGATYGFFFDTVSLHIYFQTDSVDYIINEARAALRAFGLDKPIWINEINASPDSDPQWPVERPRWRVDLREQASFILQGYALGLAAGAEGIGVYKLMDAGLSPGGEPFGLLRPDHSRRPAYTAYQLATRHYAGTRGAYISRQPLLTQVTLDRGERTTRVFWARTGTEVSVAVPALSTQATLVDQEGNFQTLDGSNGSYSLTLPGARCADETLGCIIGGLTYILVEDASVSGSGASELEAATAASKAEESEAAAPSDVEANEATATPEGSGLPTATSTSRPTPPAVTIPPTFTPSPTLPPSPSPAVTPSPIPPTGTPTQRVITPASPTPTASATPTLGVRMNGTATASVTQPLSPISPLQSPILPPDVEPSPAPSKEPFAGVGLLSFAGLVVLAGLVGFIVWQLIRRR